MLYNLNENKLWSHWCSAGLYKNSKSSANTVGVYPTWIYTVAKFGNLCEFPTSFYIFLTIKQGPWNGPLKVLPRLQ